MGHTVIFIKLFSSVIALCANPAYDPTGISYSQCPCRYVLVYYASRTDDTVVTDGYSGQDTDMRTYPYVIADGNRQGILQSLVSLFHVKGVSGCIEATIGSNEYIVAELYLGSIQYNTVYICVEVIAYFNIISVIALERLFYQKIASRFSKQSGYNLFPALDFRRQQVVIFMAEQFASLSFGYQLRIVIGIV